MALPTRYRLTKTKDFDQIFKEGKTVRGSFFFIKYLRTNLQHLRAAIVVPAKLAPLSVERHRTKRVIANQLSDKKYFLLSYDLVVVVTGSILGKSSEEIKIEILKVMSGFKNNL